MTLSTPTDLRILVIDDNPAIHQDFLKILTAPRCENNLDLDALTQEIFGTPKVSDISLPNFQIDSATQGEEGLNLIEKALAEDRPYALAFVDVRMPPGWDGIQTIKHIWSIDKNIQIVICTAYSDYTWEETVSELGQNDNLLILKKPFDHIAVRQLACALTKKWELAQEACRYTLALENHIRERTDSLQQSISMMRSTLESSADGILVVNNNGHILDYNNKFSEMWNIPKNILETKNDDAAIEYVLEQLEDPQAFLEKTRALYENAEEACMDRLKFRDGRIFERYSQPYKVNEDIIGRVWNFRDISKRVHLEEKLQYQATHDTLTNLLNRPSLLDRIHQTTLRAKQNGGLFAILFLDLDRFKLINDSLSHSAGDELLRVVAQRLEHVLQSEDTLARLGGDEFVILIDNVSKKDSASKIARKILEVIGEPFTIANHKVVVTGSLGISVYPKDGDNADILIRNADAAMYHAKELGANQYKFYNSKLNEENLQLLEREAELRQAIGNNELFLCYQPQFDLNTKKLIAVEALIRWQHPVKGLILPMDFIPLAEETGLIVPIGNWVLRTACQQNKKWQQAGLSYIQMAVNITTQQFKQPGLVNIVRNLLQEIDLQPHYLALELTENVIISNLEVIRTINELKELGVQIVLDDFGTGYSSLSYLKKIPLDRLKIDKSFIQNIDVNRGDEIIIQAITAMAHSLNLDVIAEGVETPDQLKFVTAKNCEGAQGYFFSKPLVAAELESLLVHWSATGLINPEEKEAYN